MTSSDNALSAAARHWSSHRLRAGTRWWQSPVVLAHVNRLVCGDALPGPWAGLNRRLAALAPDGGFARAISIGCGNGVKEIELLRLGIVERFDLFEISAERVAQGAAMAARLGLSGRARFVVGDAFAEAVDGSYDLVYWNNALHHMLDVPAAVRRSHALLRTGGVFAMDDFVGPARFQWTDVNLDVANRVRALLPEDALHDPAQPGRMLSRTVQRPDPARLAAIDPTEAVQSDLILPSIAEVFSEAEVKLTGGCIYHLALNDVIANLGEMESRPLLDALLLLDEALARAGHTHYAVALARLS
jgi:SAM-dependent methyltransferase